MKKILHTLVFASIAAVGFSLPAQTVSAAPFFKCNSGYSFGINGQNTGAHCKKKSPLTVKPISCPNVEFFGKSIGTFPYAKSGKDKCRGSVTVAGVTQTTDHNPLACPSGYSYKQNHQGTKDRCVKGGNWIYKAPTRQFNS